MQTNETIESEEQAQSEPLIAPVVAPMLPETPPERTLSSAGFYAVALGVIILDQLVKEWARAAIPLDGSVPLWAGVFQLTHTQNRGMAFSLLPGQTFLLAAAAIAVGLVIVFAQRKMGGKMPLLLGFALSLPLGGAMGNLIDRVRLGYVTDLFDFRLIHFPVFNVADAAITVGILLLMWRTLMTKETTKDAPVTLTETSNETRNGESRNDAPSTATQETL